jgi:hypothetical protein
MNDFHPAEPLEGMQPINTLILAQRNWLPTSGLQKWEIHIVVLNRFYNLLQWQWKPIQEPHIYSKGLSHFWMIWISSPWFTCRQPAPWNETQKIWGGLPVTVPFLSLSFSTSPCLFHSHCISLFTFSPILCLYFSALFPFLSHFLPSSPSSLPSLLLSLSLCFLPYFLLSPYCLYFSHSLNWILLFLSFFPISFFLNLRLPLPPFCFSFQVQSLAVPLIIFFSWSSCFILMIFSL